MTKSDRNANRKRQAKPTGYRAPATAPGAAPRKGLLDSLFAPKGVVASPMPKKLTSLARGFVTVISTPAILAVVAVGLILEWVALLGLGFQGPFSLLAGAFAWPGPGTYLDGQLSATVFGGTPGALFSVFAFLLVRAALISLVSAMAVEQLRSGVVSGWSLRRSLRVLPVAFAANMMGLGLLLVAWIASQLLGQLGFGFLVFIAGLVAAVWLTAAAPAVAADEDRRLADVLQRSYRVARMPGSGNMTVATVYALPAFAVIAGYAFAGGIGVNPSAQQWAISIGVNLLHAAAAAMFAYRYLAVAPFVDEAPAPAARRGP